VVHADEIIVLDRGAAQERGNHAALLQAGGRYAALWHAQHAGTAGVRENAVSVGLAVG
jgi:ABC-type multidrug transport system fused ATPase/permease subunit